MIYLDTNVLISAVDDKDLFHSKALELLDKYRRIKE